MPFLLRADRVQRAPGRGLERPGQQAEEAFGLRQLHQPAQGALLVRDRHVDQDAGHGLPAGRAVDALLQRGGGVSRLRIELADHEVGEGVAQQEARRDLDLELGNALRGALDVAPGEGVRTLLQGAAALPALQQRFVEGEEDALSIQLQRGQPAALPGEVRGREPPLGPGAPEPLEHHDFLEAVDRHQTRYGVHRAGPRGPCVPHVPRVRCASERLPAPRVVFGDEVLVFPEIGDLFDQRPVLVRQQVAGGDRSPVQGITAVDCRDGFIDLAGRAAILAGEPSDGALARQRVPRSPDTELAPGAAVQAVDDRSPADARFRGDDERRAGRGRVHPDVVDLQQQGRGLRCSSRRLAHPGLLPSAGRERYPRQRARRQAGVRSAEGATHDAAGSGLVQLQIRLRPVGATSALFGAAGMFRMRQNVPGDVRQIAVLMHEDPRGLLQPAAAVAAFSRSTRVPCFSAPMVVAATGSRPSPGRTVHQAALRVQAAHPGRKPERRDPSDHRPAPLHRARRRAERALDAERAPHPVHVADLPLQGIGARTIPKADVLHHHQAVRPAHDGPHGAFAQQVRETDRDVFFSHGSSVCSWSGGAPLRG